jgi:peroxiredoxin
VGSFSNTTRAAPSFQLRTIDGNRILLTSFRGKPVRLFMAACRTCIGQSEAITKVKSEFGNNVDLLMIDMWTIQAIGSDKCVRKVE